MTWNNGRVGQCRQPGYGFGLRSQGDFDPRTDLAILAGSQPSFLHVAGDGNTPTIGPALTTTGTIAEGAPIVLASGGALRTDAYTGTQHRQTLAGAQFGIGDDAVVAVCATFNPIAATMVPFSSHNAATVKGWGPYLNIASQNLVGTLIGDSTASPTRATVAGPNLVLYTIVRGGDATLRISPALSAAVATPAGTMDAGGLIRIGAGHLLTSPFTGRIAWVAIWYGAGIGALWTATRIAQLYALAGVA